MFREFVLEKRFARLPTNRIRQILLDLHVQNQLFVNLHTQHVQLMKRKKLCNVVRLFSAVVNLSAGARYTKYIANLVPSVLSLAVRILFFSGIVHIFKYPRHQLSNKRGGKLLSGPDRATYVVATIIIYCSSPPLFLAPRFWVPRDQPQLGFFSNQEREPWERGCCILWFSDVSDTFR